MITLKNLEKIREVTDDDISTYRQGKRKNTRTCVRLSEENQAFIRKHSIWKTSQQIADAIGHTPNSVRAYARRHNIILKKARHYE